MEDESLKKEMDLKTFLYCLKHLKVMKDNRVRLLGWEPLLHSSIEKFFYLAVKWNFEMTIFSNFKIPVSKWETILDFWNDYDYSKLQFNLNLNDESFYKTKELDLIYASLSFLKQKGCSLIISYNVYEYDAEYDFIFTTAQKFWIKHVILKPTNTVIWEQELIDTNSRKYGEYIMEIIRMYSENFTISFGCGLSSKIFTKHEKKFIEEAFSIPMKYWCWNNGWRYDINTDGTIYRCYPLQDLYNKNKLHISSDFFQKSSKSNTCKFIDSFVPLDIWLQEDENCLGNQFNKK